jgi:hypothetical protein
VKPGGLERVWIGRETRQSILGRQFNRLRLRLRISEPAHASKGASCSAGGLLVALNLLYTSDDSGDNWLRPVPLVKPTGSATPRNSEPQGPRPNSISQISDRYENDEGELVGKGWQ